MWLATHAVAVVSAIPYLIAAVGMVVIGNPSAQASGAGMSPFPLSWARAMTPEYATVLARPLKGKAKKEIRCS